MRELEWAPGEGPLAEVGPLAELREGSRLVDLVAMAAVPAVLVVVFLRFAGSPGRLVLSSVEPTPIALVSAHFVHHSADHLVGNLAAYGFVVPTAYALAVRSDRRSEFRFALAAFLLVLPPALSGLILLAFESGVSLGFSGVLMAFVGLLPLYLGTFVDRLRPGDSTGRVSLGLFSLGVALIGARSLQPANAGAVYALIFVAIVVAIACLGGLLAAVPRSVESASFVGSRDGQFAVVGFVAFSFGLLVGFPADPYGGPAPTNVYGHLLGYALGFLIPYVAFHLPDGRAETEGVPDDAV